MTSSERPLRDAMTGFALLGPAGAIADGGKINERLPDRYEWRASTFSLSAQADGAIGVDQTGTMTCVWSSRRQHNGRYGVYAQQFDANGIPIGSERVLNLWSNSHQTAPAVAMDHAGGAWAVGSDHVVLITNGAIAFFTKDGTLTFQDEIEGSFGFWGSVGASGFVFDPEVIYDELSGRFFAMASDKEQATDKSFALLAVSDDADPNGNWLKYRFETTLLAGSTFDSPNIGVNDQAVYITGDFGGGGPIYPVFIFDKASLLVGNPPAVQNSFLLPTQSESAGIPPVSFDDPPALYLIEHREFNTNTAVRLIALQNVLTSPTITSFSLTVPVYGRPEDPPPDGHQPTTEHVRLPFLEHCLPQRVTVGDPSHQQQPPPHPLV